MIDILDSIIILFFTSHDTNLIVIVPMNDAFFNNLTKLNDK